MILRNSFFFVNEGPILRKWIASGQHTAIRFQFEQPSKIGQKSQIILKVLDNFDITIKRSIFLEIFSLNIWLSKMIIAKPTSGSGWNVQYGCQNQQRRPQIGTSATGTHFSCNCKIALVSADFSFGRHSTGFPRYSRGLRSSKISNREYQNCHFRPNLG